MKSGVGSILSVAALVLVVAFASWLAFTVSMNRNYQVDEIEHVHSAFNAKKGLVIYRDFWEGHNPLIYGLLQPVIDEHDPAGTFGDGRLMVFCVLLGIVALAAFIAYRLAGVPAALLAAGLLLTHTTFVERAIEIRPDPFMTLATIFVVASEFMRMPVRRRFALQGIAIAIGFLATQKTALIAVAVGLRWLLGAWRSRRLSLVLLPCAVFAVPVLFVGCWLWANGGLPNYLEYNVFPQLRHLDRSSNLQFSPMLFLPVEADRNLFFSALSVLAVAYAALLVFFQWRRQNPPFGNEQAGAEPHQEKLLLLALYAVYLVFLLWLNPFPYPYFHVIALPCLAVLGSFALIRVTRILHRGRPPWIYGLSTAALALALMTSLPRLQDKAEPRTKYQLEFIEQVHAVTPPDGAVIDLTGLHFRRDGYPVYVMTSPMLSRYRMGAFPRMIPYWRKNNIATFVYNYRTFHLPTDELQFIKRHFVRYTAHLFVPGRQIEGLSAEQSDEFEVLSSRNFRFEGEGALLLNGREFTRGLLSPGVYTLSTNSQAVEGRLIVDVPLPTVSSSMGNLLFPTFD